MPYVYLVTSPNINVVKVGRWSNDLKSLMSRYKTYYGQAASIYAYATNNDKHIEKQFMSHFANMKVSNELFKNVDDSLGVYRKYMLQQTKSKEESVNHSDAKAVDNTKKTLWTLDYFNYLDPIPECRMRFTFEVKDNLAVIDYMGIPLYVKLENENFKQKLNNIFISIVHQMVHKTCKVLESDKYCDNHEHIIDNRFQLNITNSYGEDMFSAMCYCDPTLDSLLWHVQVGSEHDKDLQLLIDTLWYYANIIIP